MAHLGSSQSSSQPFTRSRTQLFLSFRATSTRPSSTPYTPYIDDDDALESTGLMTDLEHGRRGSTMSLGAAGRRGGAGASGDKLPPRWVDWADRVDDVVDKVKPKIAQLDRLHAKHLLPGFKDRSAEEREIESLATSITADFRTCQAHIRRIAEQSKSLLAQRPVDALQAEAKRIDLIMAANVQTALATKVQDLSTTFRKKQAGYLRLLKGNESRAAELHSRSAQDPLASLADDENASRSVLSPSTPSLAQRQLFSPSLSATGLEQREHEIQSIAQSIADLADLFKDLSSLVIDQGTLLDRIDYNVEQMSTDIKVAVEELKTATRYQRRSGKCQLIFLLILAIVGCLIIIAYKPRHWGSALPPTSASPNTPVPSAETSASTSTEDIAQAISEELNGRGLEVSKQSWMKRKRRIRVGKAGRRAEKTERIWDGAPDAEASRGKRERVRL